MHPRFSEMWQSQFQSWWLHFQHHCRQICAFRRYLCLKNPFWKVPFGRIFLFPQPVNPTFHTLKVIHNCDAHCSHWVPKRQCDDLRSDLCEPPNKLTASPMFTRNILQPWWFPNLESRPMDFCPASSSSELRSFCGHAWMMRSCFGISAL